MKKLLFILCLLPMFLMAQDANPPSLFEVDRIKVKPGQEKQFEAAVKAHNAKFHPEGPYFAQLFYNINGPFGGEYSWIMGPTNYAALDDKPGEGAHDDDWTNNVAPFVESIAPPAYWSRDPSISNVVTNPAFSKSLIWVYDIAPGQGTRFSELIGKIQKVYKEKRPNESYVVVWNNFANTKAGTDAAIVWSFEKWAYMDDQRRFAEDYEAVHGAGTWHSFLNEFNEVSDGRVDWIRERVD